MTVDPNSNEQIDFILAATRQIESSNRYDIPPNSAQASGAYQFIPTTWQSLTKRYGIGTQYDQAYKAPVQVQDAIARNWVHDILVTSKGDPFAVPKTWNPKGGANYVNKWSTAYKTMLSSGVVVDTATAIGTNEPQPVTNPQPSTWTAGDSVNAVKDGSALAGKSIADGFTSTLDFVKLLAKSGTWVRVLQVVGGVGIIGFGLYVMAQRQALSTVAGVIKDG